MKDDSWVTQSQSVTTETNRLGSTVSYGGFAERSSRSVSFLSSTRNPKPWSSWNIGPQSYLIFKVYNNEINYTETGFYIQQPYVFRNTYYGRLSNSLLCYKMGDIQPHNWDMVIGNAYSKFLNKVRGDHANLAVDLAEVRSTVDMFRNLSPKRIIKNAAKKVAARKRKSAIRDSLVERQRREPNPRDSLQRETASRIKQVRQMAKQFERMISSFTQRIEKSRGYRKIRPGPTQGQRRLDYVTGKWLEYRYGWVPLLSSIHDTLEAVRKSHTSKLVLVKGRSRATESYRVIEYVPTNTYMRCETQVDSGYGCEYGGWFSLPSGIQYQDFTSLNPLSIAWELVPFSFVADWFANVGQVLENWENWFTYRNNYVKGYMTTSVRETRNMSASGSDIRAPVYYKAADNNWYPFDGWTSRQQSTSAEVVLSYKQRLYVPTLPTPIGPRVKVNLNPKRLLDSAALISQYVRKFR